MDCGDDSKEGQQRGMGVGLGGRGIGDHMDLDNKGVCKEKTGNNHGYVSVISI